MSSDSTQDTGPTSAGFSLFQLDLTHTYQFSGRIYTYDVISALLLTL